MRTSRMLTLRLLYLCLPAVLLLPSAVSAGEGPPLPADLPPLPDREADARLAAALRERSLPLRTAADLDPLLERFGRRRGVLLGESSHGTEEFYAWRAELSKRLIVERGFRFIAVEGDWGACMAVNRYVKHLDDAPRSAREALDAFTRWPTWLWSNRTTLELVEWLREHNARLPPQRRVGFYGLDLYGMNDSLDKAPRYLRRLDGDSAALAERAYDCLRRHDGDMQQYLRQIAQGGPSCAGQVRGVVERLQGERDRFSDRDREAYFHAKQNALVVLNADLHYRMMLQPDQASWNARARHFHRTFERLLEHYGPDARGIGWAHNTHIGDARATEMARQGMVNIGHLLRESLAPEEVALIGFGTHRGRVVAAARWEAPQQVMQVPPARDDSLEHLLHQAGREPYLLLTADLRDLPGIDRRIGHRAIGVSYNPRREAGNYVPTVFPARYDAFLFTPETTPLRPIEAAGQ